MTCKERFILALTCARIQDKRILRQFGRKPREPFEHESFKWIQHALQEIG